MVQKLLRGTLLTGLYVIILTGISTAQTENKPLKVGDKIPDLVFNKIFNHKHQSAKLSDFKSHLVILDIWSKTCGACIGGFPKMEKMKSDFKPDLNVLLITENSENDLMMLRSQSPIVRATKLPIVVDLKEIRALFPSPFLPLHVWLDSNLTVLAITSGNNTTPAAVSQYLEFKRIEPKMRNSFYNDYNSNVSLLVEGNGRHIANATQYSIFFESLNNIPRSYFSFIRNDSSKLIGMRIVNMSVLSLLAIAYPSFKDKMIFTSSDPEHNYSKLSDIERKLSYEIVVPESMYDSSKRMFQFFREDINRFLNISTSVEKRNTRALILDTLEHSRIKQINISNAKFVSEEVNGRLYMKNVTLRAFASKLSRLLGNKYSIIDNTLADYYIEVDINLKEVDSEFLKQLNYQLNRCGLKVESEEKSIDFLVVENKN